MVENKILVMNFQGLESACVSLIRNTRPVHPLTRVASIAFGDHEMGAGLTKVARGTFCAIAVTEGELPTNRPTDRPTTD